MQKLLTSFTIVLLSLTSYGQFGFEKIDSIPVEKNGQILSHPWSGGISHGQFSNFDANFDGIPDLFVFDRADDRISVYIRNNTVGDVNFTYVDSLSDYFPQDLTDWVLLRDYNCDGKMDIFASRPGGIKIYRNDSQNGVLHFTKVIDRLNCSYYTPGDYSSNVYASSGDIPGIEDIDGDGDLDVLSFENNRNTVSYFKNYSMEKHGVCDSLIEVFELRNECWGKFSESNSSNAITLNSNDWYCQNSTVSNPELPENNATTKKFKHDGSTILPIDIDNSGVYDLVIGDVSFNNLILLTNGGSSPNTNSAMVSMDNNFPSNTTPVDLYVFPAAFYVDVTNDGNRDLLVSTNLLNLSLAYESVWYYENIGTDALPNFIFRTKTFLQDQSLQAGLGIYPEFYDHNQDGLQDLILGNYRNNDPNGGPTDFSCYVSYYENIGTASAPKFKYITNDYQNLSTVGVGAGEGYIPTFGDLDGDGDDDMVLGNANGKISYFENTAGSGNPSSFQLTTAEMECREWNTSSQDYDTVVINVFSSSAPELVDLNRDGLIDLVVGRKDGKLSYYKNLGASANDDFFFQKVTDNLGGVNTSSYLSNIGSSVPEFVDHDNEYHLFLGSDEGGLYYYKDIDNNLSGNFTLVDSIALDIKPGEQTGVAIAQLYDYHPYTMVMGTFNGQVLLYQDNSDVHIGLEENKITYPHILFFPNPTNGQLTVRTDGAQLEHYQIYDLSGKLVQNGAFNGKNTISLTTLTDGIYIIKVVDQSGLTTSSKIVKE